MSSILPRLVGTMRFSLFSESYTVTEAPASTLSVSLQLPVTALMPSSRLTGQKELLHGFFQGASEHLQWDEEGNAFLAPFLQQSQHTARWY